MRKTAKRSPFALKVPTSDALSLLRLGVTSLQFFPSGSFLPRAIFFPATFRGSFMRAILLPIAHSK
jgi:hypothetical protein